MSHSGILPVPFSIAIPGRVWGRPGLLLVLLAPLLLQVATAEEMLEFDVPARDQLVLVEGQLDTGFALTCRFAIDRKNTNARRAPWISIWFLSGTPGEVGESNVRQVALYAYRQGSSEFFGEPIRWHYVLFVAGPEMRDSSEEIGTDAGRESVITLSLARIDETKVLAVIGEQADEPWTVDISPFELQHWQVIVSGLKGRAFCIDNAEGRNGS